MRPHVASLALLFWLSGSASGQAELRFEYRLIDNGESRVEYRPLRRTSLLYRSAEFRVLTSGDKRVAGLRVLGIDRVLCRSSEPANRCIVDFGDAIASRELVVEADLEDPAGGAVVTASRRFRTLDTHSAPALGGALTESSKAEAAPPDRVTRLVRVESTGGRADRPRYHDDLTPDDFRVKVHGIGEARITLVRPPDPARRKLIPILFDVAVYLEEGRRDPERPPWREPYRQVVRSLVGGLRAAAASGVDAEYVVVPYAATGRLFGPFRLQPGIDSTRTLAELEQFLSEPPLREWTERARGNVRASDFGSVIHTLNDQYLRGYDGLVQVVWVTAGGHAPARLRPTFQEALWPERFAALNPTWPDDEFTRLLECLDDGLTVRDAALTELLRTRDADAGDLAAEIDVFMRRADRGATDTLHPHRVDSSPIVSALFLPSKRSLREDRMMEFSAFVREQYGGEVWRLLELDKTAVEELEERLHDPNQVEGVQTVAGLLRRTHEQLAHSYVVEFEVPNEKQDGARHELTVGVSRRKARARLMPSYTSSRPVRQRLPDYLGSAFKSLRALSAFELRRYPFDERLDAAWNGRWHIEGDEQVRAVLFESWVATKFKRLQAPFVTIGSERERHRWALEAHAGLLRAGAEADRLPDPVLAREAAALAGRYREDHPQRFGD